MGLFDFFNSDERKKNQVALEIDLEAGVLERCPVCRSVFDRQHDDRLAAADAIAHMDFDNNQPRVAIFEGDRDDLLKRLREVRKPVPYACICESEG